MIFKNRAEAGKILAEALAYLKDRQNVVVLGIPRGGVVVAAEVSKILKVPLSVVVVRKLGVPGHSELAFGAVDVKDTATLDRDLIRQLRLSRSVIDNVREREWLEAKKREKLFRWDRNELDLKGKIILLIDDGLATGATTTAAINYIRKKNPAKLILAVPVAPPETVNKLRLLVDDMTVLQAPPDFTAVGQFYSDFPQVSGEEVINLLSLSRAFEA